MPCETFRDRLHELLDRRESPVLDSRLIAHAQWCQDCRETLRATESLLQAVEQLPAVDQDRIATRSTVGEVEGGGAAWRHGLMAATLLIGFTIWSLLGRAYRPLEIPDTQLDSPVVQMGTDSTGVFVYQPIVGLSLLSRADWSRLASTEVPFAAHVPPLETDWLQEVANEMQPVQQSMSNTLELLRRSLLPLGRTSTMAVNG